MKTYNTTAAAMTLAAARAVRELDRTFGIRSDATAITRHLAEHPTIFERALKDVDRWRTKFKTSAQNRRR